MTKTYATVLKVFGATLFAVLTVFALWSIFLDPHGNDPLTPDQQERMDDMLNKQSGQRAGSRSGVTVVEDASVDESEALESSRDASVD